MEIVTVDGGVSRNFDDMLERWRGAFDDLLNAASGTDLPSDIVPRSKTLQEEQ